MLTLEHLDVRVTRHHDAEMRTTLTLDDDVAARLKELARRKGISFRETVNTVLRRGFSTPESREAGKPGYTVRVFRSEFRPGVDLLRLNQLSDDLETEGSTSRESL